MCYIGHAEKDKRKLHEIYMERCILFWNEIYFVVNFQLHIILQLLFDGKLCYELSLYKE